MLLFVSLAAATALSCEAASRESGIAQRACYGELAEQTDRAMAAQWRITLARTRRDDVENRREKRNVPNMAAGLLASQRAWLRYRDAQCGMVSDQFAGGTGYGEFDSRCRITLNRQRTAELKRRAEGSLVPPA